MEQILSAVLGGGGGWLAGILGKGSDKGPLANILAGVLGGIGGGTGAGQVLGGATDVATNAPDAAAANPMMTYLIAFIMGSVLPWLTNFMKTAQAGAGAGASTNDGAGSSGIQLPPRKQDTPVQANNDETPTNENPPLG
jgi:uncharacterized membrane protein YeaQ/YmgE (transglycosylase-associated protein family)